MKTIFLSLFILSFFALKAQDPSDGCIDFNQIDSSTICPLIYAPVCGCDNITYENDCVAENLGGVTSFTFGECGNGTIPDGCIDSNLIDDNLACTDIYEPVCGCDGVTYGNGCYATNFYGITSFTEGACENIIVPPSNCIDSSLINPNLSCTMIYDPVCGCDGITYSNGCIAAIGFGITNYTMGECTSVPIDYVSILNVNIYPNPASLNLNVEFLSNGEHKTHDVKLIDLAGKTMFFDYEMSESQYSIPLMDFSDGIYFLHILSDDKSLIKKIIINK